MRPLWMDAMGATVSVQARDPQGAVETLSATTGANGTANVTCAIDSTNPLGAYAATSTVASGSASASATTSFVVKWREQRPGAPAEARSSRRPRPVRGSAVSSLDSDGQGPISSMFIVEPGLECASKN